VRQETAPENVSLRFTRPGVHRKFLLENWTIRRELSAWGADVLFSAGDTSLLGCPVPHLLLIHQANLTYAVHEHGAPTPPLTRLRWRVMSGYLRLGLPSVSAVTVQTHDMASRFSRRFGVPAERVSVIPSAVGGVPSIEGRQQEEDPQSPYLVFVSGPEGYKNHQVLGPMMDALRERHEELRCHLTVNSAQVPELAREIAARGLADAFVFHGRVPRDEALRLVHGARVAVIPSRLESFGLSYYEAMAEGTPVVAADRDFAREACGDAGIYADIDSGEAFAEAVLPLLEDEDYWRARSQAVRLRHEQVQITWEAVAQQYLKLLEGLGAA